MSGATTSAATTHGLRLFRLPRVREIGASNRLAPSQGAELRSSPPSPTVHLQVTFLLTLLLTDNEPTNLTITLLQCRSVPTISARAHAAATAVGFSRLALHVRLGTYTYYGVAYYGHAYCG